MPVLGHICPVRGTYQTSLLRDTASHALGRKAGSAGTDQAHSTTRKDLCGDKGQTSLLLRQVLDNQSRAPWRLSSITDFFWSIADFVVLFFQSIIQPDLRRRGYTSSSYTGHDDGRGPPGYPRRRMGRINHWGGGPSPPPMAGGG
uniref:Selenoprotein K n=1 Tax=Apteryx owenii TaxID=8824 RepID=A0A8B9PPJ1_APTOW